MSLRDRSNEIKNYLLALCSFGQLSSCVVFAAHSTLETKQFPGWLLHPFLLFSCPTPSGTWRKVLEWKNKWFLCWIRSFNLSFFISRRTAKHRRALQSNWNIKERNFDGNEFRGRKTSVFPWLLWSIWGSLDKPSEVNSIHSVCQGIQYKRKGSSFRSCHC